MYKKQRGQKRRLEALLNRIDQMQPFREVDGEYERFLVPCGRFIASPKTSGKIKTAFLKAWLDKTAEMISKKPDELPFCKVVAMVDEADLWNSQIVIFYDEGHYASFWQRDCSDQAWEPIMREGVSLMQGRHLHVSMPEKGYVETICDEDLARKTVLWFYGDMD